MQAENVDYALAILNETPTEIQSSPEILNERVGLLLLKRDYKKARKIEETFQLGGRNITNLQILLLRAKVCRLTGDYKSAKENFRKALDEANAHSNDQGTDKTFIILERFAIAQTGLGRKEEALKTLDKILKPYKDKGLSSFTPTIKLTHTQVDVLTGDNT